MDFPRLDQAEIIGIDCETHDPDLEELGIGTTRDGYIAGVAISARFPGEEKIHSWYMPVRHEGGGNLDRATVWRWLNENLNTPIPKTGANLQYDLAYLWNEGVRVAGPFLDVQIAEPLLDENRQHYSLEALAQDRLGEGKDETDMLGYIRQNFGAKAGKEKGYIWRCPSHIVASYARTDVVLPVRILDQQLKEIEAQELQEVWQIEQDLLPILVRMHLNGVRVDHMAAQRLQHEWTQELGRLTQQMGSINAKSTKQMADYLLSHGITPPKTDKGNWSVTGKWLESLENPPPLIDAKLKATKYSTFLNTFIAGALRHNICGRIHGQFNQLRSDEYGTVTGRLSAAKPNLQNIPNPERDPYFASACRGLYLPEHGQQWLRFDYSQIEYRLLVHFASTLPGGVADLVMAMFRETPDIDFHLMCAQLLWGPNVTKLQRKYAKNINFGLIYGMGVPKLARSLGLPLEEAKEIFNLYHEKAPFAKAFTDAASQRAQNRGYVRTIAGRRRRFDAWESAKWIPAEERDPNEVQSLRSREAAVAKWGRVRRAHTHAAGNAVLQGSSADITKRAMVLGEKHGIYDVLGYPLVTVHDELGFSIASGDPRHEEAAREMNHLMANAYKLAVPVLVSEGRGASWGTAG